MAQGYFNREQLTALRSAPPISMGGLEDFLTLMNQTVPIFKARPSIGDAATAATGDHSSLIRNHEVGRWIDRQGGLDVVYPRLAQSILDIYATPRDPDGRIGANQLLRVLEGDAAPRTNVQRMFKAILEDYRETHPAQAEELVNRARADFNQRFGAMDVTLPFADIAPDTPFDNGLHAVNYAQALSSVIAFT